MMYLGVRIEENIETKEQKVYFFIPASLLPLVRYNMTANSKEPDKIQVGKEQAYPVRLFYEVGLKMELMNMIWSKQRIALFIQRISREE